MINQERAEVGGAPALFDRSIGLVLLLFLVLGLTYSIVNPLYEATDELRHYRFVRTLATTGRLPVQGQEPCRSQSHHPPLFYALGALATSWIDTGRDICFTPPENPFFAYRYWEVGVDNKNQYLHGADEAFPWYGDALAAHIIRALNVLIGAGAVWLTWATGRAIWPRRPALALGASAFVAFNPMFLYMAGAINNDVVAAASGAAVLYGSVRLLRDPAGLSRRWGVVLGVLFGLALLSKFNLAASVVLIEAAVTWQAWQKRSWRSWLVVNGFILLTAGVIAGWWFVRNQLLYGEPTGFETVTELWGVRDPRESFGLAVSELPYAWTTLWGRFGFGQIPLPRPYYDGLLAAAAVCLLGAVAGFLRATNEVRRPLLLLAANVLLFFAVLFNYMLVSPAGPNGRFFFPALSALALLIFYGLSQIFELSAGRLFRGRGHPSLTVLAGGANLVMLTLALIALGRYLEPAYARPPDLGLEAEIPNPLEAHFDSLVTLLGYRLEPDAVQPGEALDVQLYWEVNNQPPGDYLLFIHLIDGAGTIVAQRDTHPGLGNFPASEWRPGDRFKETVRVFLPETAYAPEQMTVNVGLYAPDAYRLGITGPEGQELGDALTLGTVTLAPKAGAYPNSQDQNFNNEIRLVGYEYSGRQPSPGESVTITLYWETLTDVTTDYVVLVHLLNESGRPVAIADGRPGTPTDTWRVGQVFVDSREVMIESGIPAGTYAVDLALLDGALNRRQNIVADDGHWIDDHLLLARLRVRLE